MRLLKVEKRMSAKRPPIASTARSEPRRSTPRAVSSASSSTTSCGMRSVSRCARLTLVRATAIAIVQPMPSCPIARPESTLVTMKARPCTVPTRPFAFACRSSGTSIVTVVESAMLRICSTTAPPSTIAPKSQNHGAPRSSSIGSGSSRYKTPATEKATSVTVPESSMTRSLR